MRNKKWSVLSLRYHESSLVGMHEERWVLWAETRHTGSVGISVLCFAQPVLCHNSENCNTVNCWTVCNKHFQVPSLLNKSIFSRYSSDFLIYCFFFFFSKLFPLQRNDRNLSYYHLPEMLFLLFLLLLWGTPISDPSRILQFSFLKKIVIIIITQTLFLRSPLLQN